MARQKLSAQFLTDAGTTLTLSAVTAADGATFDAGAEVFLLMRNTTGSPINVTIQTTRTVDGLAVEDRVIAVPANGFVAVKPLNPSNHSSAPEIDPASNGVSMALIHWDTYLS